MKQHVSRSRTSAWLSMAVVMCTAGAAAGQDAATDYTQWRGQNRDGSASGFVAPTAWPDQLTRRWSVDVGEGYSTPLIVGDRVFAMSRRNGNEILAALDAGTGKVIWEASYAAPHTVMSSASGHGQGPKSTPLYHDGRLFTLGITGIVSAFNAADGKVLWQKAAPSNETLYGNSAMSPIADQGSVIFHVGGHDSGALTAFDAATGNVRWSWNGDGPAYASPVIATFGGVRQVVAITQRFVVGIAADTGQLLWQRPFSNQFQNNSITPVIFGDTVLIAAHDQGILSFSPVLRSGKWDTEVRWQTTDVSVSMSNPVLVGETLYGLSQRASGQYFALNARSGAVRWLGSPREAGNSAVVKAGDLLLLLNDDGELVVARASEKAFEPLKRYTVADSATWAQPAVSGSRIFVKDVDSLTLWTIN